MEVVCSYQHLDSFPVPLSVIDFESRCSNNCYDRMHMIRLMMHRQMSDLEQNHHFGLVGYSLEHRNFVMGQNKIVMEHRSFAMELSMILMERRSFVMVLNMTVKRMHMFEVVLHMIVMALHMSMNVSMIENLNHRLRMPYRFHLSHVIDCMTMNQYHFHHIHLFARDNLCFILLI